MGILASYMMIDEPTLEGFFKLESTNSLLEQVYDLEEQGLFERYDLGKIWDALHCFLTGVSASTPIDGSKLSEAIVGIHFFQYFREEDDFVTCTENRELGEIIDAMEKFDLK